MLIRMYTLEISRMLNISLYNYMLIEVQTFVSQDKTQIMIVRWGFLIDIDINLKMSEAIVIITVIIFVCRNPDMGVKLKI